MKLFKKIFKKMFNLEYLEVRQFHYNMNYNKMKKNQILN